MSKNTKIMKIIKGGQNKSFLKAEI